MGTISGASGGNWVFRCPARFFSSRTKLSAGTGFHVKMKARKDYSDLYREMVAFQNWHWWFRVHYAWILDLLKPHLRAGVRFLDMGCGPGVCSSRIPLPIRIVLLDIRPLALSYCVSNPHGRICGDAKAAPFQGGIFDIVICSDLLHQRDVEDPRRVVNEAFRLCRPGGVILLVEPAFPCLFGPHDEVENGCRRYTTGALLDLFADGSVTVLRRTYLHLLMFVPAFLVRRMLGRHVTQKNTDLALGNNLTNTISYWLESAERWIGRYLRLPFGTSAALLVRRDP